MRAVFLFVLILSLTACGGPEPRRPVKVSTGSFMKESVERNKELLAAEEAEIMKIIEADTLHNYHSNASGSWYYYVEQNEEATYLPKAGDLVTLSYNMLSLQNDTIYSADEIGIIPYQVDKEELFPGLRNSVKLLKEGETAVFLFPSSQAYGYHGDDHKIGTNVPVKSSVTLLSIQQQKDSIQN